MASNTLTYHDIHQNQEKCQGLRQQLLAVTHCIHIIFLHTKYKTHLKKQQSYRPFKNWHILNYLSLRSKDTLPSNDLLTNQTTKAYFKG